MIECNVCKKQSEPNLLKVVKHGGEEKTWLLCDKCLELVAGWIEGMLRTTEKLYGK